MMAGGIGEMMPDIGAMQGGMMDGGMPVMDQQPMPPAGMME